MTPLQRKDIERFVQDRVLDTSNPDREMFRLIEEALRNDGNDAERLDFMATHLQREAQIMLSDGLRDCWAWAISSAKPDLRAAIDAARQQEKGRD